MPAAQSFRDNTILQPRRDQEDRPLGFFLGDVERELDLLLDISLLGDGLVRQANDHHIRIADGFGDLEPPILTGQQFLLVQPGIHPLGSQSFVQVTHWRFVPRGVTEKHLQWPLFQDHIALPLATAPKSTLKSLYGNYDKLNTLN